MIDVAQEAIMWSHFYLWPNLWGLNPTPDENNWDGGKKGV